MNQKKSRYGSWMLVTKKPRPPAPTPPKQQRQAKKSTSTPPERRNQFGALADVRDAEELPSNRDRTTNRTTNGDPGKGSKGKSPVHHNPPRNRLDPPQSRNSMTQTNYQHNPAQNARGRGGRSNVSRGKGKNAGSGRDRGSDPPSNFSNPTTVSWNGQRDNQGIFLFGNSRTPNRDAMGAGPSHAGKTFMVLTHLPETTAQAAAALQVSSSSEFRRHKK
nr:LINE-type retrotransposon LIb DNA [Ipomoea trifida]